MKLRPILFSGPMVRALLDGTKTQTRRIMSVQPDEHDTVTVEHYHPTVIDRHGDEQPGAEIFGAWWADGECGLRCPYGQPGDRLWVRESFAFTDAHEPRYMGSVEYRADNKCMAVDHGPVTVEAPHNCDPRPFDGPWKPSIHMPRWASRITLEITAVRVERLQDISADDAWAEGIPYSRDVDPVHEYRDLWEQINGEGSWEKNPWIWAITFRRFEANHGST